MTYAEVVAELTVINASIEAVTGGAQSYGIGGKNLVRAPLETLYKRKNILETMKQRLDPNNGGAVRFPDFSTK